MECALLVLAPGGCARSVSDGGEPGHVGEGYVRRLDGTLEPMAGCTQTMLEAGEAVIVVTPTGGGYGDPALRGKG